MSDFVSKYKLDLYAVNGFETVNKIYRNDLSALIKVSINNRKKLSITRILPTKINNLRVNETTNPQEINFIQTQLNI